MIIKVLSRHSPSYGQLIDYLFKNDQSKTPLLTQNLRGDHTNWLKEYLDNEARRKYQRINNVRLTHEIISFHHKSSEHLTDETLRAIAKEYTEKRNPNALIVASVHRDTEHTHIHCMVSGTEYASGYSARMSKAYFAELKQDLQKFQEQRFPELSASLVRHGKGQAKMTDKEYQTKLRTRAPLRKEELAMKVNDAYARATSREEFISLLQAEGIEPYSRAGKDMYGVSHDGQNFRMTSLDFDAANNLKQLDAIEADLQSLEEMRNREPHYKEELSDRLSELNQLEQEENERQVPDDEPQDAAAEPAPQKPDISEEMNRRLPNREYEGQRPSQDCKTRT